MPRAKDVMSRQVVYVTKDTPMLEAANLLVINDITGIPVVDEAMHLVGIITEKDILDLYDVIQYPNDRTVNASMSREVISFDVEDDLNDLCTCLGASEFRRVPITCEGRLVGVVSRRDLILHVLRMKRKHEESWV